MRVHAPITSGNVLSLSRYAAILSFSLPSPIPRLKTMRSVSHFEFFCLWGYTGRWLTGCLGSYSARKEWDEVQRYDIAPTSRTSSDNVAIPQPQIMFFPTPRRPLGFSERPRIELLRSFLSDLEFNLDIWAARRGVGLD